MSDARAILPGYLPQDKSQYLQSLEDTDNMFASLPPKPLLGDTSLAASGRSKAAASPARTSHKRPALAAPLCVSPTRLSTRPIVPTAQAPSARR